MHLTSSSSTVKLLSTLSWCKACEIYAGPRQLQRVLQRKSDSQEPYKSPSRHKQYQRFNLTVLGGRGGLVCRPLCRPPCCRPNKSIGRPPPQDGETYRWTAAFFPRGPKRSGYKQINFEMSFPVPTYFRMINDKLSLD